MEPHPSSLPDLFTSDSNLSSAVIHFQIQAFHTQHSAFFSSALSRVDDERAVEELVLESNPMQVPAPFMRFNATTDFVIVVFPEKICVMEIRIHIMRYGKFDGNSLLIVDHLKRIF